MVIIRLFIALMLVISVFSVGCKSGIRIEELTLPTNSLEKAHLAFVKNDDLNIFEDYAAINQGNAVGDGFTMKQASDPEHILDSCLSEKTISFIRIPDNAGKKDQLFDALSAAALRAFQAPKKLNFYYLNLSVLNHEAEQLHFSLEQTKEYYIHAIKMIQAKLSSQDIVLINLDTLRSGIPSATLLTLFAKNRLIVISSQAKSTLDLNLSDKKGQELFLRGLNIGEIYQLLKAHFRRTKALADDATNDPLAIKLAKIIAAATPFNSLGNFSQILHKISPLLNGDLLANDAEENMVKIITEHAQINHDFFVSLDVSSKTMTEINDNTLKNIHYYTEETIKRDEMISILQGLQLTGTLHGEQITDLIQRTERAISEAQNAIEQNTEETVAGARESLDQTIRQSAHKTVAETATALKTIKNDLNSSIRHSTTTLSDRISLGTREMAEKLGEEAEALKDAQDRSLKTSLATLGKSLKQQGQEERSTIIKQLQTAIDGARLALLQGHQEAIETAQANLQDAIKRAAQASSNRETKQEIKQLKDDIAGLIKRAEAQITEANARVGETLAEKITETGEDIKQASGLTTKTAFGNLDGTVKKESSAQQKAVIDNLRAAITEAQHALDEGQEDKLAHAQENLTQAFNRAINRAGAGNQNAVAQNSAKVITTLEGLIKKAKAEITEHTSSEGALLADKINETSDDIKNATDRTVKNAADRVTGAVNLTTKIQQQASVTALKTALIEAQQALDQGADEKIAQAQANLEQAFARVVNRANAGNRVLAEEVGKKLAAGLSELIKKAKAEITEHTSSEGALLADKINETSDDIKNATNRTVKNAADRVTGAVNNNIKMQQQASINALKTALVEAQQALDQGADEKIAQAQANLEQAFARVVNRANAGNRALAEEVGKKLAAELREIIKRAQNHIVENTSAESQILADKLEHSENTIIDANKRNVDNSANQVLEVIVRQNRDQQKAITREIKEAIVSAQQALEEGHEEKIAGAQNALAELIKKSQAESTKLIEDLKQAHAVVMREEQRKLRTALAQAEASLSEKITEEASGTKDTVMSEAQQTRRKNLELLRKLNRNFALKEGFDIYNFINQTLINIVRGGIGNDPLDSVGIAAAPQLRSVRIERAAMAATRLISASFIAGQPINGPLLLQTIINEYSNKLPGTIVQAQNDALTAINQQFPALLNIIVARFQAVENLNEAPAPNTEVVE